MPVILHYRHLSNGYLIDLSSPQLNICWGISNQMDQVYPGQDIKYYKSCDHFDCVLFNLQLAYPFSTNQLIIF